MICLPTEKISHNGAISDLFLSRGITTFKEAIEWLHQLRYGRNSNRADYLLVFKENKGTCSTKHALLVALSRENDLPIRLKVGICKFGLRDHSSFRPLLDTLKVDFFPEAHCYCNYEGENFDLTHPVDPLTMTLEILEEHEITPQEIGKRKSELHRIYLQKWMKLLKLDEQFSVEEILALREKCILKI